MSRWQFIPLSRYLNRIHCGFNHLNRIHRGFSQTAIRMGLRFIPTIARRILGTKSFGLRLLRRRALLGPLQTPLLGRQSIVILYPPGVAGTSSLDAIVSGFVEGPLLQSLRMSCSARITIGGRPATWSCLRLARACTSAARSEMKQGGTASSATERHASVCIRICVNSIGI